MKMINTFLTIGEIVRYVRTEFLKVKITQEQVGRHIKCTQRTIGRMESGESNNLLRLRAAFDYYCRIDPQVGVVFGERFSELAWNEVKKKFGDFETQIYAD